MALKQEIVVRDCPEYLVRLKIETFDGLDVPFLHCDFRQWGKRSFRQLIKDWKRFRQVVRGNFFALSNGNNIDKWRKFVERLGFVPYEDIVCPDGVTRPCYVSWDSVNG